MKNRTSPRWTLTALLAVGCGTVAGTNRKQVLLFSEAQEQELGAQAYQETLAKEKISTDPAANALVTRVGQRIAAATGKNYAWEFKVIDNPKMANAFCLPGGKVAVYTGILPLTADEAGLAAVIGHEVAHAVARHGGERASQGALANLGVGAVVATMGQRDPNTVKLVAAALGAGAAVGVLLPFSRDQESEADKLGLMYMARAGYNPDAAVAFWQRMAAHGGGGGDGLEFLSSHPSHSTRIADIQKWLPEAQAQYAAAGGAPAAPPSPGAPAAPPGDPGVPDPK